MKSGSINVHVPRQFSLKMPVNYGKGELFRVNMGTLFAFSMTGTSRIERTFGIVTTRF